MASLTELANRFNTREKCLSFLEKLRFPGGLECPRCKDKSIARLDKIHKLRCRKCRYMFSVTAGTIFHKTHLPLQKWILATFLICNAKKGISAKQIERDLDLTYETAWYLMHRIRRAMKQTEFVEKFKGIVEADETYLGGKKIPGKRGRGAGNKAIVIGIRQRNGKIRAELIPNVKFKTISRVMAKYVRKDAEMLCVDELPSYNQTNGIESFWAVLKRGFIGTHHKMSVKYLPLYLNEFTWRFSQNGNPDIFEKVLANGTRTCHNNVEKLINANE